MTLALPGYAAHHRAPAATLLARLAALVAWIGRRDRHKDEPVVHVGATETTPVIDPEPVTDPLDPKWRAFEPDRAPAAIFDELDANTPVNLDWQPPGFTETWSAATTAALRDRLAAEDAAAAGEAA